MSNTRTKQGQFAHGNPGGPGRPRRQTEAGYLRVVMSTCPLDAWEEVVRSAVDAAKAGDHQARRWLSQFLIGDPATAPKPTAIITEELLGTDPPLDAAARQLAKKIMDRRRYPILFGDDAEEEAVVRQCKAELEAAEVARRQAGAA